MTGLSVNWSLMSEPDWSCCLRLRNKKALRHSSSCSNKSQASKPSLGSWYDYASVIRIMTTRTTSENSFLNFSSRADLFWVKVHSTIVRMWKSSSPGTDFRGMTRRQKSGVAENPVFNDWKVKLVLSVVWSKHHSMESPSTLRVKASRRMMVTAPLWVGWGNSMMTMYCSGSWDHLSPQQLLCKWI